MLMPSRFYRNFKCIAEWKNSETGQVFTVRKTIDLGDVSSYEEYADGLLDNSLERTYVFFSTNKPPVILRIPYNEFNSIFEQYHAEQGTLDNRTQKKRLNYSGPMKFRFDNEEKFLVSTGYPKDFSFINKSSDEVYDAVLYSYITTMS